MTTVKRPDDSPSAPPVHEERAKSGAELRKRDVGFGPTLALDEHPFSNHSESSVQPRTLQVGGGRAMSAPEATNPLGTVISERYRLDRELGRGGMGQVFLGHHLALDVPVAVKVMLPSVASDPVLVRRFQREARATSALKHPNIVRVLDFGVHAGAPYLVMEYLQGEPLSMRLAIRNGWLPIAEVDVVMRGLLAAFEMAHNLGIVHRDLKPDNIYLAHADDGEVVKVLDFGLAHMKDPKEAGPTLTRADMVSGTPEYMSPEQCRSLKVGPSADIYSIGCVLTEMLQGRPPFDGASSVDVMTKQMFYEAPGIDPPAGADPVSPAVERLRLSLLAKRPSNRPADIAQLRARWIEALNPDATHDVTGRKDAEPSGTRAERAPQWDSAQPKSHSESPPTVADNVVAIVRMTDDERGVDDSCIMGLHAHSMAPYLVVADDDTSRADVMVLDAGSDVEQACGWLAKVEEDRRALVLVCADAMSAQDMSQLIESGAGGVIAYPIAPDTLRKKLSRLLRKAKRRATLR